MTLRFPPVQTKYYQFGGGLDQVSPPLTMPEGFAIKASNVEVGTYGGYSRIQGYERYDGQTNPSSAQYNSIPVTVTGSYAIGNTITGVTSGATAVLIAATASTWYVTKVVGTFVAEVINIAGAPVATSSAGTSTGGAATMALNATYLNLAADQYRADIAAVPGSGSILGVWRFGVCIYAFRNNAGGTAAVMYKSSVTGWTAVTMYNEVSFTVGAVTTPADSETLTQGGVTATVKRVVTQSGTWAGTAAGRFIITNPTGGNFAAGAATLSGGATVTLSAVQTAITFLPGGEFEFVNYNFGGAANTTKMYGCDGANRCFEFDGTTLVPIVTGMATDTPEHITAFKKHLFISIAGSVQHSGIGTPYIWTPITGAAELAVGDQCTGFMLQTGGTSVGTMVALNRNQTYMLYGNSSTDWNLVLYNPDAGAVEWTAQYIGQGVLLDDRGITTLATSQNFGNFASSTLSRKVDPTLRDLIDSANASCTVREKNQYRLFFSGGSALYVTFEGTKLSGIMPVSLTNPVTCIASQENTGGVEEIYFGSTNGMVYQMERGTSFDGEVIDWNLQLSYNHFGSPRTLKQYKKAVLEISGSTYCEFDFSYLLGYGSTELSQPGTETITNNLSSSFWDSFVWDNFFWDGQNLLPSEIDIDGTAENVSLVFSGSSDEFDSFTMNGVSIDYIPRRRLR